MKNRKKIKLLKMNRAKEFLLLKERVVIMIKVLLITTKISRLALKRNSKN
jgi:hypothetical protein